MALNQQLVDELAQIISEMPPVPVELVLATGEIFTTDALNVARAYDKATACQQDALREIAGAFGVLR